VRGREGKRESYRQKRKELVPARNVGPKGKSDLEKKGESSGSRRSLTSPNRREKEGATEFRGLRKKKSEALISVGSKNGQGRTTREVLWYRMKTKIKKKGDGEEGLAERYVLQCPADSVAQCFFRGGLGKSQKKEEEQAEILGVTWEEIYSVVVNHKGCC